MKRSAAPANFLVTNSRIREPNRKQVKQPVLVTPRSHPRKSVPKPTTISLEFEKVLHENATRIQKWFRQIKANQKDQLRKLLVEHRKKEPSTRPSRNKKTVPKQQKMVKRETSVDPAVMKRRQERANAAKLASYSLIQELVKEFKQKRSQNSSSETLVDIKSFGEVSQNFQSGHIIDIKQATQIYHWMLGDGKLQKGMKNVLDLRESREKMIMDKNQKLEKKEPDESSIKAGKFCIEKDCTIQDSNSTVNSIDVDAQNQQKIDDKNIPKNLGTGKNIPETTLNEIEKITIFKEDHDYILMERTGCDDSPSTNLDQVQSTKDYLQPEEIIQDQHLEAVKNDIYIQKANRILFSSSFHKEESKTASLVEGVDSEPSTYKEATSEMLNILSEKPCVLKRTESTDLESKTQGKRIQVEAPKTVEIVGEKASLMNASLSPVRKTKHQSNSKVAQKPIEPSVTSISGPSSPNELPVQTPTETTDKSIERILGFLKTVQDDESIQTISPSSNPSFLDAMETRPIDSVKQKIIGQQIEIDEKTRALEIFKAELKRIKEEKQEAALQFKEEIKSKTGLLRREYEAIIKRHLGFIDKLLAEKDELAKKCNELGENVKTMEKGFKDKFQSREEQFAKDIKQQRELWQATEKLKRDKWIQEKTKQIKDQTVKGLEPEIQRMLGQHKIALRQLEETLRQEFGKDKELLLDQHQRQLTNMRDRIVGERQKACEEEREFARQRYQKQLERDDLEFQQQKRKLLADFNEEKHNMEQAQKEECKRISCRFKAQIKELEEKVETQKASFEKSQAETRQSHAQELSRLTSTLASQHETWQKEYSLKTKSETQQSQKEFQQRMIAERDAEIELVISRLSAQGNADSSHLVQRHRMEIERIKTECANSLRNTREECGVALERVSALSAKVSEMESERKQAQLQIAGLENQLVARDRVAQRQNQQLERLQVDEQQLTLVIRREFEDEISSRDREIIQLKEQVQEVMSRMSNADQHYTNEIKRISTEKEETLRVVEEQVRKTVLGKDEAIASLRRRIEEQGMTIGHLEKMIESQRIEICSLVK